jgi:hypothetical protein
MPYVRLCKLRQLACAVMVSTAMPIALSGIALAGYGPPPLPPPPVPGGFSCVVTSRTVGPAGKIIGPLRLHGLVARLGVRGAFPVPVQVTITQPYAQAGACQGGLGIGNAGFPGYRTVGGVGILVQLNGVAYRGIFARPLVLRLASRSIARSSLVVRWNGMRFVKVPHAVVRRGLARVRVRASSDFAVLVRAGQAPGTDAGQALRRARASAAGPSGWSPDLDSAVFRLPPGLPPPRISATASRIGATAAGDSAP